MDGDSYLCHPSSQFFPQNPEGHKHLLFTHLPIPHFPQLRAKTVSHSSKNEAAYILRYSMTSNQHIDCFISIISRYAAGFHSASDGFWIFFWLTQRNTLCNKHKSLLSWWRKALAGAMMQPNHDDPWFGFMINGHSGIESDGWFT